jgi:hypothetical protein
MQISAGIRYYSLSISALLLISTVYSIAGDEPLVRAFERSGHRTVYCDVCCSIMTMRADVVSTSRTIKVILLDPTLNNPYQFRFGAYGEFI